MYAKQYYILNKLDKLLYEKFGEENINIIHNRLLMDIDNFIQKKKDICNKLISAINMFDASFYSFDKIENVVNKFICELNMLHDLYDEQIIKQEDLKNEMNGLMENNAREYWGMMIFSKDVVFDRNLFEKVLRYEIITHELDNISNDIINTKNKMDDIRLRLTFYAEIKNVVFTNKNIKKKIEKLLLELDNLNINQKNKNIDKNIDELCDDLQKMIKISFDDNIRKMIKLCDNFEGMELFQKKKMNYMKLIHKYFFINKI